MDMDEALQTFIAEARELLQEMEDALLGIEHGGDPAESVKSIFRAAHTVKGSAGLFGLDRIVSFTHVVESVLDKVRSGTLGMDADLVALLLSCGDHIASMINGLVAGVSELGGNEQAAGAALVKQLSAYLDAPEQAPPQTHAAVPIREEAPLEISGGGVVDSDNWHISLRFGPDVLRNGMDPVSFFRYLETLGDIVAISSLFDAMPPAEEMDPESCYMGYEINFRSSADKAAIEGVFEFVRDDCQIHILPPGSRVGDFLRLIKESPEGDMRIGDILIRCGTLTARELEEVLAIQSREAADNEPPANGQKRPLGEILVDHGLVQPAVVEAALEKQKQSKDAKVRQQQLVRVDAEKLDLLINLVGELVIAGAGVNTIAQRSGQAEMLEATSTMSRLIEEVRDGALKLRMVQIGETFNRFQRVVRDVSKELGKDIGLEISGGDTELDKTVVEKIGDPLTHLVRNSIDHGVETADLRAQRGKPARGTVCLNAYHESGSIVIEVSDDGGGLSRDRILAKAIEKGLVSPSQTLTDDEIHRLIFEAGFSTADQVSNISGRGVGMDVVRRNIEALRGTIEIESEYTVGTTIRIRLPLTLAIIDGFQVGVGKSSFVIPLEMVVECVDLSKEDRAAIQDRNYINLRGEVLPFMRLRDLFEIDAAALRRESVVVVQYGSTRAGLVVDTLLGEFQTVIKPLGKLFERMKGIGGSTILGSGEVALILDVPNLVQQAAQGEARRLAPGKEVQLASG